MDSNADLKGVIEPGLALVPQVHIVYLQKRTPMLLTCPLNITDTSIVIEGYDWYRDTDPDPTMSVFDPLDITKDSPWYLKEQGSLLFKTGYKRRSTGKKKLAGVYECVVRTNKGDVLARKVHVKLAGELLLVKGFNLNPNGTPAGVTEEMEYRCY